MTDTKIDCCAKDCPIGKAKSAELLERENSAYDAAIDFWAFVSECSKTCKYIEKEKEASV
jgi:hypothetical protein